MAFLSSTFNSERRGRRALTAMLIAVGACAAIDMTCRWLLPMSDTVTRNRTAREYFRAEPVPDIQIFGDSVIDRALVADALSDGTPLTARNDALASSRPPTTYYLLREQLAEGKLPKAIVFAHIPRSFDDAFTARLAGSFAEWHELPSVYAMASRPTEAVYGTLARFSYLLMLRKQFKDLFLNGDHRFFSIPEDRFRYTPDYAREMVDSYMTDPVAYEASQETFDGTLSNRDSTFSVSAENDEYFRKTLELAKSYEVPVFWLTPLAAETTNEVDEENGYYDELAKYLEPFEQSGDLIVLELRPEVYADELFSDYIHPKALATIQFSCSMRRYASVIAEVLGEQPKSGLSASEGRNFAGSPTRLDKEPLPRDWKDRCHDLGSMLPQKAAGSVREIDASP